MKTIHFLLLVTGLSFMMSCNSTGSSVNSGEFSSELKTKLDTISYLYGYSNGKGWKQQGLDNMDMKVFMGAVNEAYAGEEPKVDLMEGGQIVRQYIREIREKQAADNLEKANSFLEKNGKKNGVVTTETGLQYEVLQEGKGQTPGPTDNIKVNYVGKNIEGEIFDQNKEGIPGKFNVSRVVSGWTEALQLMPVGSKYRLFIPPSLGYGERGTPAIGPNEVLIFDVELLEIEAPIGEPTK